MISLPVWARLNNQSGECLGSNASEFLDAIFNWSSQSAILVTGRAVTSGTDITKAGTFQRGEWSSSVGL
jgi:hypothetical protein